MTPDVVVDIGNSRVKFGWCGGGKVEAVTSFPAEDTAAWDAAVDLTRDRPLTWAVASVHPPRLERFLLWAAGRGETAVVLGHGHLPLRGIDVKYPERVGIDRLLAAVGALARTAPGTPVVVINAGTAVTVDLTDETRTFRGGAILPGPWLMARSLHDHTAGLPLVELHEVPGADPPGRDTESAITVGVMAALMGGCQMLVEEYAALCPRPPEVFMTGGAIGLLIDYHFGPGLLAGGPFPLVLEGLRIAAEALP